MRLFKRKPQKYEFRTYSGRAHNATKRTNRWVDEGWELAGSATPYTANMGYEGVLIPFKRKIKM